MHANMDGDEGTEREGCGVSGAAILLCRQRSVSCGREGALCGVVASERVRGGLWVAAFQDHSSSGERWHGVCGDARSDKSLQARRWEMSGQRGVCWQLERLQCQMHADVDGDYGA